MKKFNPTIVELPTIVDERKEEAILLTTVATAMLYELDRLVNLVKEVLEYADTNRWRFPELQPSLL